MEEILFRGKRVDNGEWVEGDLLQNIDATKIREQEKEIRRIAKSFEVSVKTVGQFTGLYDKNGKMIFEDDIVKFNNQIFEVVFETGCFGLGCHDDINYKKIEKDIGKLNNYLGCYNDKFISLWEIVWNFNSIEHHIEQVEIIGNIHDNPELLGGEDEI